MAGKTFGDRLQDARKDAKLTQEQLGEAIGVSKSQISYYESDKDYPSYDKLIEITRRVKKSADFLLTGAEIAGGKVIDPETYERMVRLKKLPDVLQEFVMEALTLAEETQGEIPTKFLKPPSKESWNEFHLYLMKLAEQLRDRTGPTKPAAKKKR